MTANNTIIKIKVKITILIFQIKKMLLIFKYYLLAKWRAKKLKETALRSYQQKRLKKILKFAVHHSPFYRQFLSKSKNALELTDFPIISKKEMMENFNQLNTLGLDRDTCFKLVINRERHRDFAAPQDQTAIGLSSGTSGSRGLFVADTTEQAMYAGNILAKVLDQQSLLQPQRIAYFLRSDNSLYRTAKQRHLQMKFFDPMTPLGQQVDALNQFNPTIFLAPCSVLRQLGPFLQSGALQIKAEKIYSIAEVLSSFDAESIKRDFSVTTVHQLYQCTEGQLGATCKEGIIHLCEDLIYFEKEWLDESQGKFIPILTDLYRTSQPHIRYRLNDVLTLKKEPCSCGLGYQAIESIEGREDDILYFSKEDQSKKNNEALVTVFADFIRRVFIFSSDRLDAYQLIQYSLDLCEIKIRAQSENSIQTIENNILNEFQQLAQLLNFKMPKIKFSSYHDPAGDTKLRRIQRVFSPIPSLSTQG